MELKYFFPSELEYFCLFHPQQPFISEFLKRKESATVCEEKNFNRKLEKRMNCNYLQNKKESQLCNSFCQMLSSNFDTKLIKFFGVFDVFFTVR